VLPGPGDLTCARACRRDAGARGFYDLGPYHRIRDHQKAAGIVFQDTASVLFGVEGLQVTDAQALPDGTLEVWAVTGDPAAAACPDCGTVSARRHDTVLARPRDVRRGGDLVAVWWVKFRWKCDAPGCDRKTFTERVPQVPPRCRLTARLREQAGTEVAGRGITPAEAARARRGVVAGGARGIRRRGGPGAGAGPRAGGVPGHR